MNAKIYCEITCNHCGSVLLGSGYYKNTSIIAKLKENAKQSGWIWDNNFGGNLCPACRNELKESE